MGTVNPVGSCTCYGYAHMLMPSSDGNNGCAKSCDGFSGQVNQFRNQVGIDKAHLFLLLLMLFIV